MSKGRAKLQQIAADRTIGFLIYSCIAVAVAMTVYPLYFVVIASFSNPVMVSSGQVLLIPKGLNVLGYEKLFEDARIWTGYRNTILYTVLGTAISLIGTMPAAFAVSRKELPFRRGIMFFFTFTMFFSGGLIPTFFLIQKISMVDTIWAMLIPFSVSVFNLIVARTYFQTNIPEELFDAARIDGCSYTRFFVMIALPLSKAIIAVIGLYYAVGYWNEYMRALIYIKNAKLVPLQLILREILIQNQAFQHINMDNTQKQMLADIMKYALIVVSTLPLLVLYPILQKYFEKGVMLGSIKG